MNDPLEITDPEKLLMLFDEIDSGNSRVINDIEMADSLKQRVRGQDQVIDDLSQYIRLQWGKEHRSQPIASLLFVGPPATGKTELAKAMTEYLFEDEKKMLRFDCADLTDPQTGKTALIGSPGVYQGSEGGRLTKPMFQEPRRLILFDEIEKAHSSIFDLFLSLMGDGRLTDQRTNKVADFTQAIIILTSNEIHEQLGKLREQITDPDELGDAVRAELRDAKSFRPEIISRFDQIYVFQPLSPKVMLQIAAMKIKRLGQDYNLNITFVVPEIIVSMVRMAQKQNDMRMLSRIATKLVGRPLMDAKARGLKSVRIIIGEDKQPKVQPS